jgi:hypothetical protein
MMSKSILAMALGLGLSLGAATVLAQAPAPNATLKEIGGKGNVLVNQGEEFVPAAEGMRLKPGDRVMAQDDSEADIQFDDQCTYEVKEQRIVTIPSDSPCAGGVPLVQSLNPAGAGAVGATAAAGTGNAGPFLLAAGIETAIYFLLEDDDDTVSP